MTCKIHCHFHITDDIKYFGPPIGYDASTGERNLKWWAKSISKTARKCGQGIFLEQTSRRVSENRLLLRAKNTNVPTDNGSIRNPVIHDDQWKFTRKKAHDRYNVLTEGSLMVDYKVPHDISPFTLLTPQIRQVLRDGHNNEEGSQPEIEIWKEIMMTDEEGPNKYKYVRAFHHFDVHGRFFDWVHVTHGQNGGYVPALVLLLYRSHNDNGEHRDQALVWKAVPATNHERKFETNISARWKMKLLDSGLPHIETVELNHIEQCIKVYPHWRCKVNCHLPATPLPPGSDRSMFVIDECYDRYGWLLNFVDSERWES